MADYITYDQYRIRHNITTSTDSATIGAVITEASRMIDGLCGRRFDADAAATARVFHPVDSHVVWIDDALEISAVKTDVADDGSYGTTWDAADYQAWPLNGVGPNMVSGWPYTRLHAIESKTFPTSHRRASVQVTAKWGWAAVPNDISGACYLLANRLYEERRTPFGTVGSAEFGAMPIRDQRTVLRMLGPYMRREPVVA